MAIPNLVSGQPCDSVKEERLCAMGLRPLVAVAFVALLEVALGPAQTEARLTCSKEEYVRTGLEFVRCQDDTIKYYNILKKTKDTEENPSACNSLKHIVYNCVEIVRHCFDDRGRP